MHIERLTQAGLWPFAVRTREHVNAEDRKVAPQYVRIMSELQIAFRIVKNARIARVNHCAVGQFDRACSGTGKQ